MTQRPDKIKNETILYHDTNEHPPHSKDAIPLPILLVITLIVGLLFASARLLAHGVDLAYNPDPTWKDTMQLGWPLIAILPAIFLILGNYIRNFLGKFFLMSAVVIGFYFGAQGLWATLNGSRYAWLFLTPVLYFALIVLTVVKIRNTKRRSALE